MKRGGFTLVEFTMTAVILGIIALAGAPLIIAVNEGWITATTRSEFSESAKISMDRMVRLMRRTKDDKSVLIADNNIFKFINTEDNIITFDTSVTDLRLTVGNATEALASDVNSFSLVYYDENGLAIAAPKVSPSLTNIRRIQIDLVFSAEGEQLSFQCQVAPRRLQ